ncbi:MAG: hypothetical protein SFX73_21735 [Kofleriaceae bacterium]|nr:hypothetical protein [Kofleriaceae bacterium]
MRLGLVLVVLCSCITPYDPCDELTFQEFSTTSGAVAAVLDAAGPAKVYAVGEYHPTRRTAQTASPLARFTSDIIDQMMPRARHLVVEAWTDTGCGGDGRRAGQQIAQVIGRPPAQKSDIEALVMKSAKNRLATHGLQMTCLERGSLLDRMGHVDFLRLLELVTEKLQATTKALVDNERAVIVYGGALHNDLYPRWPLGALSYAEPLQQDLGGGVVEIDLIVPEVVAPLAMIRNEGWFPLLGRSAPGRTLVWERGPGSYVLILPAQSLEPAKVALPVASI